MKLYVMRVAKEEGGGSSGQKSVAPNYGPERVIEQYTTANLNFQLHP
jgi:hypothetical protein